MGKIIKFNGNNKQSVSIQIMFNEFIKEKMATGRKEETLSYYNDALKSFGKFFNLNRPCSDITEETILAYENELRNGNLYHINNTTVSTRLKGLRAILYYAMSKNYLSTFQIKMPKKVKTHKDVYSMEELQCLLKKPLASSSFAEFREWTIANHVMEMGLRAKSLRYIKISDVDLSKNTIFIRHLKSGNQKVLNFR